MIIYSDKIKKIIQNALDGFLEGNVDRIAERISEKANIPVEDICVFVLRERGTSNLGRLACILNCGVAEPYTEDDWGLVYLFKRSKEADEREI